MRRSYLDRKCTTRNHHEHLRTVHGWPRKPAECVCDLQANRFRKRDAFDCGNPRCAVCHYDKLCGHLETLQERRSRVAMLEQIGEISP